MNSRKWSIRCLLACATGLLGILYSLAAESPAQDERAEDDARVSVAVARDRAKVMQSVYAATLEVMHERYFHNERAIVPARALEDVFDEIAAKSQIKARWISVNTKPMSVSHEPKTDFEKQAAAAISAGKTEFERVEQGQYQRAAPIPLASGCVSCHTGFFSGEPKSPRFAALVISVPVEEQQ